MTPQLIYGFDPLCGWCYGFGPALRAIREEWPELGIDLRMGGLVTGERIRPYHEAADYIAGASKRMTSITGVALGDAFHERILGSPTVMSSSIPPCDALLSVKTNSPERVIDLATALQVAHFKDGEDLNDAQTYERIVHQLGMNMSFDIPTPTNLRTALAEEFESSRRMGLTAYPSLLLQISDDSAIPLNVSYEPKEMIKRLKEASRGG